MILESLVTTINDRGDVNVAPMGPSVDSKLTQFTLRPFRPSTTHDNLRSIRKAVIHISDDVSIFARAVIGSLTTPPTFSLKDDRFQVLADCCRYFAVEIEDWRDDALRPTLMCRVVESKELRPFFGFNRAKHAVIEAAILATRTHLIRADQIRAQLDALESPVEKTAGPIERQAFDELKQFIASKLG